MNRPVSHPVSPTRSEVAIETEPDAFGITVGSRRLPSRYFLAPLAGYTHLAFRIAVRELGGLGLATTDLVLATHLLSETKRSRKLLATRPEDTPLSVQIFSGETDELVRAAKWLEDHDYSGVDINMGCPMAKITGRGGGARLMCDTANARDLVARVVDAVSLPVTVKMRLGWDADHITAPELAAAFESIGVAAITVHGRTRSQGFHGSVSWPGLQATAEAVQSIPIIGNGDVRSVDDALAMRAETGCEAVAIGRGAMMDPWIFRRIDHRLRHGTEMPEPTRDEIIAFLVRHFTLMTEQHAEYSCVLFRKFAGWYGARLGIPEDLEDRLRRMESFTEFDTIIKQIRKRHGERESSIPTALVKVPNGPVERW